MTSKKEIFYCLSSDDEKVMFVKLSIVFGMDVMYRFFKESAHFKHESIHKIPIYHDIDVATYKQQN